MVEQHFLRTSWLRPGIIPSTDTISVNLRLNQYILNPTNRSNQNLIYEKDFSSLRKKFNQALQEQCSKWLFRCKRSEVAWRQTHIQESVPVALLTAEPEAFVGDLP